MSIEVIIPEKEINDAVKIYQLAMKNNNITSPIFQAIYNTLLKPGFQSIASVIIVEDSDNNFDSISTTFPTALVLSRSRILKDLYTTSPCICITRTIFREINFEYTRIQSSAIVPFIKAISKYEIRPSNTIEWNTFTIDDLFDYVLKENCFEIEYNSYFKPIKRMLSAYIIQLLTPKTKVIISDENINMNTNCSCDISCKSCENIICKHKYRERFHEDICPFNLRFNKFPRMVDIAVRYVTFSEMTHIYLKNLDNKSGQYVKKCVIGNETVLSDIDEDVNFSIAIQTTKSYIY